MRTATKSAKKKKPAAQKELPREFTVRDMNRNTAQVLAACRLHGRVIVKHRAGESFELAPVKAPALPETSKAAELRARDAMERMKQYREKIRAMGMRGPQTPEEVERVNMIIAGEI